MGISRTSVVSIFLAFSISPSWGDSETEVLCDSLKSFVESVAPGESRHVEFSTVWGRNFKGVPEQVCHYKCYLINAVIFMGLS